VEGNQTVITTPNDPAVAGLNTYVTFHQAPIPKTVFHVRVGLPPGTLDPARLAFNRPYMGSFWCRHERDRGTAAPWRRKTVANIYLYVREDLGGGQWVVGFESQELHARR
jgi:hypothetical protein